ncbi:peptidoglycan-binding protein [Rhodococcus sp. WS4]|nr:peptidoglycan-binding protein [Rhodococcus sp. WS4]
MAIGTKRISDLTGYQSVLPYASEIFGVYQPMIGWKSGRKLERVRHSIAAAKHGLVNRFGEQLLSDVRAAFNEDCALTVHDYAPAEPGTVPRLRAQHSIVLKVVADRLDEHRRIPKDRDQWERFVGPYALTQILQRDVVDYYNQRSIDACRSSHGVEHLPGEPSDETDARRSRQLDAARRDIRQALAHESALAGGLKLLFDMDRIAELTATFYAGLEPAPDAVRLLLEEYDALDYEDPYLAFDPTKSVSDVTLSPVGIVHLFRQYFFELDTFLGTPIGHVWLSPGTTVELVETTTRRTLVERTIEQSLEKTLKSERITTDKDELSDAVKQENRDDFKLGLTSTVTQSWGTGSVSATGTLNMDKTQSVAREKTHKRMREQSEKLSTEIRENFKSTLKTTTEVTDTNSKRYVITNDDGELINYELRRKMRQVGVQVQDIGSYLCWESFVDEPGHDLGLASLVHLAQPPDLLAVPDQTDATPPPDQLVPFQANAVWNFDDSVPSGFVVVGFANPPAPPEGFELVRDPGIFPLTQISATGEDFTGTWAFGGRFTSTGQVEVGVLAAGGLEWDKRVDFVVGGALKYTPTAAKKKEIEAANAARKKEAFNASAANDRKTQEGFVNAVKERVNLASGIVRRNAYDLREEERIIVYRRLMDTLMTSDTYYFGDDKSRHILAELLNSIFDVDKMLYFVAPDWWKPRVYSRQFLGFADLQKRLDGSIVSWSDNRQRPDNYLITQDSQPAPLGSSLGWLLQLDGDNLRNAFLNAPWVKAIIPIRPGKEKAAIHWLQNVGVEGSDGLDAAYAAPADELKRIRTALNLAAGAQVTVGDALEFLCAEVAAKHEESNNTKKYPDTEVNDDNKVTATPIEKVYEHGFYPLKGGFRVNPNDPNADPNNKDRHFQIFDQWIEVLPTDQVAPVKVEYDPKTGRQL